MTAVQFLQAILIGSMVGCLSDVVWRIIDEDYEKATIGGALAFIFLVLIILNAR